MYLKDYKKTPNSFLDNPTTNTVLDKVGNTWLYMEPGAKYGFPGKYIFTGYYIPSKTDNETNSWMLIPKFTS